MKTPIAVSLFVYLSLAAALGQGIVQITFDGPPVQPPGSAAFRTNYYEAGMLFRPMQGYSQFIRVGVNPIAALPDNGSGYIQTTLVPLTSLMFSFTNGALFSLLAVDLAEYSTVLHNPTTVQFWGYHVDGSIVTNSFTTDGIIDGTGPLADFQTFYFTGGFTDLTRVVIPTQGWSLDNLVVVTTPEPAGSGLLLLGGVMCFAWRACKRRISS